VKPRGGFLRSSERVEPEEYSRRVSAKLKDSATEVEVRYGQVWMKASPERAVEVMSTLKQDPDLACDYFTFLSAVDWEAEGFEVVVVVFSTEHLVTVGVKMALSKDHARLPSITGVYGGANWHERECGEMFGITFDGHPNPDKLYLSEDFIGHPLLKSFRLASRAFKPWPGAKDPEEAEGGGRA
jgi:NADH-quinone oxidoreductase subunit C